VSIYSDPVSLTNEELNAAYAALRLEEGIGALRGFLSRAYLREGLPVRDMARALSLPVPVTSAMKNELKGRGFLTEGSGIRLSERGISFVNAELGFANVDTEKYLAATAGMTDSGEDAISSISGFTRELRLLAEIYAARPAVDTSLDQSMCSSETGLRRALLILREGGAIGQKIACVGDDDLVSVALCLVLAAISKDGNAGGINCPGNMAEITVFDVDPRFLEYISTVAAERGFPIRCVAHDLREPVPAEFNNYFDAAVTDPPYTQSGLNLFLSRVSALLKPEPNKSVYLSYAHKNPQALLEAQRLILNSGYLISRIFPKFNSYVGAQILGGVSDMTVLCSTRTTNPLIPPDERYGGEIYTNERNRSVRVYVCLNCGARNRVGHGENAETIEILKARGCACGGVKFRLAEKNTEDKDEQKKS